MKLQEWLDELNMSRVELSRIANFTPQAIAHWVAGRRVVNPEAAGVIVSLSGGNVTLGDLYGTVAEYREGLERGRKLALRYGSELEI